MKHTSRFDPALLVGSILLLALAVPCSANRVVDPGGKVLDIEADPVRELLYAALDTGEIIKVDVYAGTVTQRLPVPDMPGALETSPAGDRLYVALEASGDVAEYGLPGLNHLRTFDLSFDGDVPRGLAATGARLYAAGSYDLSVVNLASGTELHFGYPSIMYPHSPVSVALNSQGSTLYVMNQGTSPASLYVLDVSGDAPIQIGENVSHGSLGGNGRDLALSPDGALLYVATGGMYHLQVLGSTSIPHDLYAGLTGPYPSAVAPTRDGSLVYVGYAQDEFAALRTSDWLLYHVGELEEEVDPRGLVLSATEQVLAAVTSTSPVDDDRIELVDVRFLTANRGGIRVRPLDAETGIPVSSARIEGGDVSYSGFSDYRGGLLGSEPLEPGSHEVEVSAYRYQAVPRTAVVTAGAWCDLGDVVLTRTGDPPDLEDVCASPPAVRGRTSEIQIHGLGFVPGLEVEPRNEDLTIDGFTYLDWVTLSATVTVPPEAGTGIRRGVFQVTNPDGDSETGTMVIVEPDTEISVTLDMPDMAHPGQPFWITGRTENPGPLRPDVPTFFVLQVLDEFWFWPGWAWYAPPASTAIDYRLMDLPPGSDEIEVVPAFTWPDTGAQTATGLWMHAAFLDPTLTHIEGGWDSRSWGYGP